MPNLCCHFTAVSQSQHYWHFGSPICIFTIFLMLKTKDHCCRYLKTCLQMKPNCRGELSCCLGVPFCPMTGGPRAAHGSQGLWWRGARQRGPPSWGQKPSPLGHTPPCTGREDPGDISLVSQHMHSCSSGTAHPVFLVCAHLRTGRRHREDLLAVLLLPPTPPPPDCLANRFHLILYQILCLFIKHAFIVFLGGGTDVHKYTDHMIWWECYFRKNKLLLSMNRLVMEQLPISLSFNMLGTVFFDPTLLFSASPTFSHHHKMWGCGCWAGE